MSAISAFFYLRVVATMYFSDGKETVTDVKTPLLNAGILAMVVAVFALGLFSGSIIDLADTWNSALTIVAQSAP